MPKKIEWIEINHQDISGGEYHIQDKMLYVRYKGRTESTSAPLQGSSIPVNAAHLLQILARKIDEEKKNK